MCHLNYSLVNAHHARKQIYEVRCGLNGHSEGTPAITVCQESVERLTRTEQDVNPICALTDASLQEIDPISAL